MRLGHFVKFYEEILVTKQDGQWTCIDSPSYIVHIPHLSDERRNELEKEIKEVVDKYLRPPCPPFIKNSDGSYVLTKENQIKMITQNT